MLPLLKSRLQETKIVVFVVVYLSFLLDNILLTVVVPIIPDYLFNNDINASTPDHFGPASLSPLQRKYEALEKDNGPMGALLASKAFVQLAVTPFVGYIAGAFGCKAPLFLGSCNMLLASMLFAYGRSYYVLVLARALHGTASAAISVSGMCILAKTVPKETRFRWMPLAFGGIASGVLIGYPFGGALYQFLGKTTPFLVISALVSINIILQWRFLGDETDEVEILNMEKMDWLKPLKNRETLTAAAAICVCTSSMAILEPCVPMWLMATLDPPPSRWQLGAVFIPDSVGYFIGSHFAGLLHIKPWRTALSALVVTGLSCCFIPLATNLETLALPHFFLGLGVGCVDATLVPMLANLADKKSNSGNYGGVYALQQISVCLAYSFGPLLGGEAVRVVGFSWLMRLSGFVNIAFCPLLLELGEKQGSCLIQDDTLPSYSSFDNSWSVAEIEEKTEK